MAFLSAFARQNYDVKFGDEVDLIGRRRQNAKQGWSVGASAASRKTLTLCSDVHLSNPPHVPSTGIIRKLRLDVEQNPSRYGEAVACASFLAISIKLPYSVA